MGASGVQVSDNREQKSDDRGQMSRFSSLSYGAAASAFVVVLDKILIPEDENEDEDEYEKYQIRSHA